MWWPAEKVVPESSESLIDLISRVLSLQSDHQNAGPIILHSRYHCSLSKKKNFFFAYFRDGSFKTGVYCCVSLLLERLKAENRVDVFQTVRSLQQRRPLMFTKFVCFSLSYSTFWSDFL
ncbi:unnamed protein product [Gongylonema pulchrum]|uniref:Tyrosine-protein phosphatase domain-containing protein n=1 Tax=Gongylonema pulchrum TaxID=637853 RepID=A0A3P7RF60_9BILA|nr:unnamed protein product [Gongylonema pulchrum]